MPGSVVSKGSVSSAPGRAPRQTHGLRLPADVAAGVLRARSQPSRVGLQAQSADSDGLAPSTSREYRVVAVRQSPVLRSGRGESHAACCRCSRTAAEPGCWPRAAPQHKQPGSVPDSPRCNAASNSSPVARRTSNTPCSASRQGLAGARHVPIVPPWCSGSSLARRASSSSSLESSRDQGTSRSMSTRREWATESHSGPRPSLASTSWAADPASRLGGQPGRCRTPTAARPASRPARPVPRGDAAAESLQVRWKATAGC